MIYMYSVWQVSIDVERGDCGRRPSHTHHHVDTHLAGTDCDYVTYLGLINTHNTAYLDGIHITPLDRQPDIRKCHEEQW